MSFKKMDRARLEDWVLCRVFYKNREVGGKPNSMGSCYDDTGSSSLPPLMDSYISFDQQQQQQQPQTQTHDYHDEQVPCFSIFSHQSQTNPIFNHIMEPNKLFPTNNINNNNNATLYGGGGGGTTTTIATTTPNLGSCLDPFSCDRKVLKAVLTQLTNMERNIPNNSNTNNSIKGSPSLGEGSSESYLSEVAMPNLWNNY